MKSHRSTFTALAVVLMLAMVGCGESNTKTKQTVKKKPSPKFDSHKRMLQDLQQVRDSTADQNLYLGDRMIRRMRGLESRLSPAAPLTDRFESNWQLGYAELRHGDTKDAIKHLAQANEILDSIRANVSTDMAKRVELWLGVAYLRQGETENCVHCRSAESCLLPIKNHGIHKHQEGSRNAIKQFVKFLKRYPDNLSARWLLNIAHMTLGTYPDEVPKEHLIATSHFQSRSEFPRFPNIAADVQLDTFNLCGGAIVDDFDGDGDLDIVNSTWDTSGQIHFFRNDGQGAFVDETQEANLQGLWGGLNLLQADYDNDGDLDVLVLRGAWLKKSGEHPNSLLQNDGKGVFRDVTYEAGLGENHYPTQTASWADYDNDGDLDLYVGNESAPSQLFRNNGNGTFDDVAKKAGVVNDRYAKGVIWGDFDNDRYPDLYVSNLSEPNRLYHNNRDGTFTDIATGVGVDKPLLSFPVWFWDFNNDGALDLFVSAYWSNTEHFVADFLGLKHEAETDVVYQGDGEGGFRNVSATLKLDNVTLAMGSNFGDLDNDGFPDFYLGTGFPDYEGLMPNRMFHNRSGKDFEEVTIAGGFGHLQKGHGVTFSDLDHDGDQDVFIQMGGAYLGDGFANALFENPGFGNHSITIKLIGTKSNRSAIGARIRAEVVEDGEKRFIYKWVNSGGSFGANPLRQQIGLGKAAKIDVLEIYWPTTDKTQRFKNVAADQFVEITEGSDQLSRRDWRPIPFQKQKELPSGTLKQN